MSPKQSVPLGHNGRHQKYELENQCSPQRKNKNQEVISQTWDCESMPGSPVF